MGICQSKKAKNKEISNQHSESVLQPKFLNTIVEIICSQPSGNGYYKGQALIHKRSKKLSLEPGKSPSFHILTPIHTNQNQQMNIRHKSASNIPNDPKFHNVNENNENSALNSQKRSLSNLNAISVDFTKYSYIKAGKGEFKSELKSKDFQRMEKSAVVIGTWKNDVLQSPYTLQIENQESHQMSINSVKRIECLLVNPNKVEYTNPEKNLKAYYEGDL